MLKNRKRRGIALVWTALMLMMMLGFVGLALDYGKMVVNAHELHNGVDAGSLAGALWVKTDRTQARNEAVRIGGLNYAEHLSISLLHNWANDPNGEVVLGRWISQERLFVPTMLSPNAVKVVGKRWGERDEAPRLGLLFGQLFGNSEANVRRHAIAKAQGSMGAGIITLSANPEEDFPDWTNHESGWVEGGNGTLDLRGYHWETGEPLLGDIQVDAEAMYDPPTKAAFVFNGNSAEIYAGDFNICGDSRPAWDSDWSGLYGDPSDPETWFSINTEQPRVEDPLLDVPDPVVPSDAIQTQITQTIDDEYIISACTSGDPLASIGDDGVYRLELVPGYYPGGISINGGSVQTGVDEFGNPIMGSVPTQIVLQGGPTAIYALGGGAGDSGLVVKGTSSVVEKYSPMNPDGTPVPPMSDPTRGVMLYITGDPGAGVAYGEVNITGSGYIQLSPRGDWLVDRVVNGELGVSIWQDRNNVNLAQIRGSADFFLSGTVYMGYNPVKVTGSTENLGSQLILGALEIDGGLTVRVGYDGRNQDSSMRAFLVD